MVTVCTIRFNIQQFYVLPTQFICILCVDLRTNSDYFPTQHKLTGFYNWYAVCLLRRTDLVFKNLCDHILQRDSPWLFLTAQQIAEATVGCYSSDVTVNISLVTRGQYERVRKISPLQGFDPRTVQPAARRCTDCAIPSPPTVLDTQRKPLSRDVRRKSRSWNQISWKATLSTSSVPSAKVSDFLSLDNITSGS